MSIIKFKNPPSYFSNLECPICLSLFENTILTNCNHFFCKKCILINNPCPICREKVVFIIKDIYTNMIISSLDVSCPYEKCLWVGVNNDYISHVNNCIFNDGLSRKVNKDEYFDYVSDNSEWVNVNTKVGLKERLIQKKGEGKVFVKKKKGKSEEKVDNKEDILSTIQDSDKKDLSNTTEMNTEMKRRSLDRNYFEIINDLLDI